MATLSKLLNIPPAQIATMGDMPNDVLMFRKSGFSIAMGNSSDEVKAQASAVTDSNENEGFAKAVRKFVLCRADLHRLARRPPRSACCDVTASRSACGRQPLRTL